MENIITISVILFGVIGYGLLVKFAYAKYMKLIQIVKDREAKRKADLKAEEAALLKELDDRVQARVQRAAEARRKALKDSCAPEGWMHRGGESKVFREKARVKQDAIDADKELSNILDELDKVFKF